MPSGLREPGTTRQYCCHGCRAVHAVLAEHGLEDYYRLAETAPLAERRAARVTGRRYAELDDAAFHRRHVRAAAGGLAEVTLYLEGVHCTACVWLTERLPRLVPGVVEVRLELGRGYTRVRWDPARVSLSEIARHLDGLGYPVHPWRGLDRDLVRRREDRALLIRLAVAGAAAGNVMMMALALYAGWFDDMGPAEAALFRWASLIIVVPAVGFAASPFFRGAWRALRGGAVHLDLPIAIGIAAGIGWGAVDTVRGRGEIYFDSIAALVFLLTAARWLQLRQQRRAADAAELRFALTPTVTRRIEGPAEVLAGGGGQVREVAIEAIELGDIVEVLAGETIPVDGVVVLGHSSIDAGLLTGESRPVTVGPGGEVHAGTVNLAARLRLRAGATGEDTRVGRLLAEIDEQARRRAPIVGATDRIAGRFVIATLAAAALTALAWALFDPIAGVEHAMALLIVTCPCALGLATPLAMSIAVGRAARRGILIKGADALERLATPGRLWLDKTGTITAGELRVLHWRGDATAQGPAAALEAESAHPLARALVAFAGGGAAGRVVTAVREQRGQGIVGDVDAETVAVGSARFAAAHLGAELPTAIVAWVDELAAQGASPVVVCRGGRAVAVAGAGDPIRGDARATVDALRRRGWRVGILSGDDPRVVARVGAALGLDATDCRGGVAPEGKLAVVGAELARGPVVMVGDGVNDAAALAAATCGIAVHGSAEAALAAADVFVSGGGATRPPGLAVLVELVEGATATMRVIRRNLRCSLAYNAIGASLAIAGVIHPLLAALLMPLSSLTVVTSSTRTTAFAGDPVARPR